MMVHALLAMQDTFEYYTHVNQNEYLQNFEYYIGDSQDWKSNARCPGGPFMKTDPGSDGWYWDERTSDRSPGFAWTYGIEVWCNQSGRYVHLVSDLRHLTPPFTMSICSIGVMGALYTRSEPLPDQVEVTQGQSLELAVPFIFNKFTPTVALRANLRLSGQTSAKLASFLTISEAASNSIVSIDAKLAETGDYQLVIESFDPESTIQPTLRTDSIKVIILAQPDQEFFL